MSAVRAYVMFRLKNGVSLKEGECTYFSPGSYSFTRENGDRVRFDFEETYGSFIEEDRLFDIDQKEIENDFITSALKEDNLEELIREQYDISFFVGGKITEEDEFNCCMDINNEEVDPKDYVEPVFMRVYDPYSGAEVSLLNKLTDKEYYEYFGKYEQKDKE